MRSSYNAEIIFDEKENTCGLFFNAGYCAEHEFGIKGLENSFGINSELTKKNCGIPRFLISKVPENLQFGSYKEKKLQRAYLYYSPYNPIPTDEKKDIKRILSSIGNADVKTDTDGYLSCAYDDHSFCVYVTGEQFVHSLSKIYDAFLNLDIAMFMGCSNDNPFSRDGLIFLIKSSLNSKFIDGYYNQDLDTLALNDASKKVLKALDSAGKEFYACHPFWTDDTKTKVKFWLNPCDQKNNFFGYVSEQDLYDWIKDKGIIPGHGTVFEDKYPAEYQELLNHQKEKF